MSEAATTQAPQTPKKTPAKTPVKTPAKKTPKKVQQSAPEPEPEESQQLPDEEDTDLTNGVEDQAEDAADQAQEGADDAEEEGEQAAGGAGEAAGDDGDEPESVAEGAQDQTEGTEDGASEAQGEAEDTADDATAKAEDTAEDAQDSAEGAGGEAAEQAQDTADDAQSKLGDGADALKSTAEDVQSKAEDGAEDAQDGAEGAADDAADDATEKAEGDGEDQGEDGNVVPIGTVGDDGKSVVTDAGQLVGQVSGENELPAGSVVDQEGDIMDSEGNVIGAAEPNEEGAADDATEGAVDGAAQGAADQAEQAAEDAQQEVQYEGALNADEEGAVKDEAGNVIANLPDEEQEKLGDQQIENIDNEGNLLGEDGNVLAKADLADGVLGDVKAKKPEFEAPLTTDEEGAVKDASGKLIANLDEEQLKQLGDQEIKDVDADGNLLGEDGTVLAKANLAEGVLGEAEDAAEGAAEEAQAVKPEFEAPLAADKEGAVKDASGKLIANLDEEQLKQLGDQEIKDIDADGNLLGEDGTVLAKANIAEGVLEEAQAAADDAEGAEEDVKDKPEFEGALKAGKDGVIKDANGKIIANLSQEELKKLGKQQIADIDGEGNLLDKKGNVIAKSEIYEAPDLDYSVLKGLKVNKAGNVTAEDGSIVGKLVDGDAAQLAGKACDEEGRIWNDSGKQIGQAEPLPESDRQAGSTKPFEDFPGAVVERSGDVSFEGRTVGKLVEGDKKQCEGKQVDADGDVSDKNGNTIGHAERLEDEPEPEEEAPVEIDYSILIGHKVNKSGLVVNEDDGTPLGKVVEGENKYLQGKKVGKEGKIYNDSGDQIGRAEPLPENERVTPTSDPFSDFQPSIVQKNGDVNYNNEKVGEVSEGDPKKLAGKQVDPEGDIVDQSGSVVGKAVRWEEPEAEEEKPVDMSALAGKRVNKQGYVADPSNGQLYGRVVEGDPKKLQGKMCDKDGNIWDEGGNKVGRAELIPESERSGSATGPFADFQPCTVTKDGTVVDGAQNIVGRIVDGDAKKLYGKSVDEDGDINDKNGNKIGSAERWEPEEKEVDQHPALGLKVNREGKVIDKSGEVIAQLTEGEIDHCRGAEVDNDGDVVDKKGKSIGHVTLIDDIKPEEPQGPSEEELAAQKEAKEKEEAEEAAKKKDRDLAKRMGYEIDNTLERVKPVLDEMVEYIEEAEAKQNRKEKVDQEKLQNNVKPLIHKGSDILKECNSNIRGMDPDGRLQQKAKQNAGSEEATPEENHLAEGLKKLTSDVQETIDTCKRKLKNFPEAEEGLSPLWGLLSEPLFQILAAVGLLLSGVLGLVGKLLGGLGLGGIVDGIMGGLGVNQLLDGLGVGGLLGGK